MTKWRHYLGDAILGAIDGCVSTFAVVIGTLGGGFEPIVALALGVSSLAADGFSMAISNYQATKSDNQHFDSLKFTESEVINQSPEKRLALLRDVFQDKGFEGDVLTKMVTVISQDKELFVNTIMQEKHQLSLAKSNPFKAAMTTFSAFMIVGLIPLLPFFFVQVHAPFKISIALTFAAFAAIGVIKALILKLSVFRQAFELLMMGALASLFAFGLSYWVSLTFGV